MPTVSFDHGLIHYNVFPSQKDNAQRQEALFILAGMGMSSRAYEKLAKKLSRDFLVFTMDHRDVPPTTLKAPDLLTVKLINSDICKILDQENISKAHFVGESYGGMLAMGMGIYYPERTLSLGIINASIARSLRPRMRPRAVLHLASRAPLNSSFYNVIIDKLFSPETNAQDSQLLKEWQHLHSDLKFPMRASRRQLVAAASFFAAPHLKKLNVPALVVYGDQDELVAPENSFEIHRLIPGAKLQKVRGGHHLCFECVDDVAEQLTQFIKTDVSGDRVPD